MRHEALEAQGRTGSSPDNDGTGRHAIAIWNMLSTGEPYNDPGSDFYARLNPDKAKNRALDQLRRMGCSVTLHPLAATG